MNNSITSPIKKESLVRTILTHKGFHENLLKGLAVMAVLLPVALVAKSQEITAAAAKAEILGYLLVCYAVLIAGSWILRDWESR